MSIAAVAATPSPTTAAPRADRVQLGIHVDSRLDGSPRRLDEARVSAFASYSLDAPAGAELRVRSAPGTELEPSTWANTGRDPITFARQGADWVATAPTPLSQLSLHARASGAGDAVAVEGRTLTIADVLPTLAVDGVQQAAARPSVTVTAPIGWQTAAADGARDAQELLERDSVIAERPPQRGVATTATFTGRGPDGASTTGPGRVVRELAERTAVGAATAGYLAMMLAAGRGGRDDDSGDLMAERGAQE